jgi:hypothetical protein
VDEATALRYCHEIVADAKTGDDSRAKSILSTATLLDYLDLVHDIISDWPKARRDETEWLPDCLSTISELRGDGERIVAADPVILYKPQHHVAREFHESRALYRYFWGGNRISKTIAGYVDDNWIATGRHPTRRVGMQGSVIIVGSDYQGYAPNVFEAKMISGENDNPLSPMFPVGGKWLHHYDWKHHIIYVACAECAAQNQAQSCPHTKYRIALFSDRGKVGSIAGAQVAQGHLDEQVGETFFNELQQRISTVRESGIIVTETSEQGEASWQYEVLYKKGRLGPPENWLEDSQRPMISLHTIDQFRAGLTPVDQIIAKMRTLPEHKIQSTIFGRHVSASDRAVFDLAALGIMQAECCTPKAQGDLICAAEEAGETIEAVSRHAYSEGVELSFIASTSGGLKVWEPPKPGEQYVIGADVAFGLSRTDKVGDYSWAIVFKLTPVGSLMQLEQVASYRGLVDTFRYADSLDRLGLWYNLATIVPENNGPGMAVIQRLYETLGCWFLFRDVAQQAGVQMDLGSQYGINTNVRSKTMLISVLQSLILARRNNQPGLILKDINLVEEHQSFVQVPSKEGRTFVLKGAGQAKDDGVMGTALAGYAAVASPLYNWTRAKEESTMPEKKLTAHEELIWQDVRAREQRAELQDTNEGSWY